MKKLPVILASLLAIFLLSAGSAEAFTVFLSGQVGASPTKNFVLLTDGTNSTWVATSTLGIGGGSGSPGGLNLQVQYNNAGAFGGISGAVTNGTILNLTNPLIGGATITTSSVNGVTLTTGGSATTFLNGAGSYTTPAGTVYTATYPVTLTGNAFGLAFATSTLINAGTGISTSSTALGAITITNTGVISNSCPGGFLSCSGTNPSTFTLGTLGTANGGTASTTALGGILVGNGTSPIKSLLVGTGLSFDGTTLTATGGSSFSYPFPASATSSPVAFNGGLTTSTLSIGSLTGTLNAAGGVVYSTATSTITAGTGIGYSGTMGSEIGGISGTLTNTGVTSIVAGTNISISGATGAVTISSTGGSGTNFFTQSGLTIAQNTGSIVSLGSVVATSTTATSTFAGDVAIGGSGGTLGTGALPNPNLFIGTSTTHTPLYGRIPGDLIDAELDWNGVSSINVANANIGSCAASTYFADGNNPTLGGYYATFSFLNDGWTDGGGAGCGNGASTLDKPEAAVLANPTGELDFDIASTSNNSFADFNWNVNNVNVMKLTNGGRLGIGTTTPTAPLTTYNNTSSSGSGHQTYGADFISGVSSFGFPSIQFTSASGGTHETMGFGGSTGWTFYDATSTSMDTTNTTALLQFSRVNGATFSITNAFAFSVQPAANFNTSFVINNSVANSATGLSVTTAATGGTTLLAAIDSGANSSISVSGKGTGSSALVSGTSNTTITNAQLGVTVGSGAKMLITANETSFSQAAGTGAANPDYLFTGVVEANLTTLVEKNQMLLNFAQINSHASGAIATNRDVRVVPTIQTFAAGTSVANSTITNAIGFNVDSPPGQGLNVNFTNAIGLNIGATTTYTTASTTNSIGLAISASTGATNNYAGSTTGRWVLNSLSTISSGDTLCRNAAGEIGDAGSATCSISTLLAKHSIVSLVQKDLDNFSKLRAVHYVLNGSNLPQYGFIAEEVAKLYPDAVIYAKQDTLVSAENGGFNTVKAGQPLTVDYEHMVPILWYQVQQLQLGAMKPVRSVEENWQDFLIGLLILGFIFQQVQINRLKK